MNDADLELYIYRILSGILIFYFHNERYELASPTPKIRYDANLIYNNIINDEKYEEWIREENLVPIMIKIGLWNKNTPELLKDLEKKIDNYKVELFQSHMMPNKSKSLRKELNSIRNQHNRLLNLKSEFFVNTLEGYAASIKNEFIICKTLYKNNKLLFDSNTANNNTSLLYFNEIVSKINQHIIPIASFKTIARSQLWRSYWNSNKDNIIPGSVSEWTDDQRTLINISKMYDSVYEHPECPSDTVIEDEDLLDGWMLVQKRKAEKAKNQQKIDELNPHLKNANEVFLMTTNGHSYEDVMSLNSPEAQQKLKSKIDYINSKGTAQEFELPDVQNDLRQQSEELSKYKRK